MGYGGPYEDKNPTSCGHGCVVEAAPKDLAAACWLPE